MTTDTINELAITSTFKHEENIPVKYTCQGEDINPPLYINGLPRNVKTLALIMEDPDAPGGTFDHWILWNIHPVELIDENSIPGISGKNSCGTLKYCGPCPPSGTHRYFFKIYALDSAVQLEEGHSKHALINEMKGHILATGELMGRYKKS